MRLLVSEAERGRKGAAPRVREPQPEESVFQEVAIAWRDGRWDEAEDALRPYLRGRGFAQPSLVRLQLAGILSAEDDYSGATELLSGAIDLNSTGHLGREIAIRSDLAVLLAAGGKAAEAGSHLARCQEILFR